METATKGDVQYDELCAECRYPIDNQGLCIMDAEHTGRWVPPAPQETPVQQELPACPFCGVSPEIEQGPATLIAFLRHQQDCFLRDYCTLFLERGFKAWNTRYRSPAFQKLVSAIEAEAARQSVKAGLGVSEWEAFLWPEAREALRLAREEGKC